MQTATAAAPTTAQQQASQAPHVQQSPWSLKGRLLLVHGVLKYGENWVSVAKNFLQFGFTNPSRPDFALFSPKVSVVRVPKASGMLGSRAKNAI